MEPCRVIISDTSSEDDLPSIDLTVCQPAKSETPVSIAGQSSSSQQTVDNTVDCALDKLLTIFGSTHSAVKIMSILTASGDNLEASSECLCSGPTLASILEMLKSRFQGEAVIKLRVDSEDAWQDTVTFYKSQRVDVSKQLQVQLNNQPALDTGGVRSQLYSSVYEAFARNEHVNLFDGPECHQRPTLHGGGQVIRPVQSSGHHGRS